MTAKKTRPKGPPLRRKEWLSKALDVLAAHPDHLRIVDVASALGVSKGSFYWHFASRSEFVIALAEYWLDEYTLSISNSVVSLGDSPGERLFNLMRVLIERGALRFELAIRAWSFVEPDIIPIIREAETIRYIRVRDLFEGLGFEGAELEVRTRAFVALNTFEPVMQSKLSREQLLEQLDVRFEFFTRR